MKFLNTKPLFLIKKQLPSMLDKLLLSSNSSITKLQASSSIQISSIKQVQAANFSSILEQALSCLTLDLSLVIWHFGGFKICQNTNELYASCKYCVYEICQQLQLFNENFTSITYHPKQGSTVCTVCIILPIFEYTTHECFRPHLKQLAQ